MPNPAVRIPLLGRKPRKAAAVVALVMAAGGGALVTASPALAVGGPPNPMFSVSTVASSGGLSLQATTVDLNGDGRLDLVQGHSSAQFTVNLGNGAGGFGAPVSYGTTGGYAVAVGDVNNDGKPDVFQRSLAAANGTVFLGVGDGTLITGPTTPLVGSAFLTPVLADLDRDGKLDLMTSDSSILRYYRGNGAGGFAAAGSSAGTFSSPYNPQAVDLNADGFLDLIVPTYNGGSVVVLLATGPFTFGSPITYPTGQLVDVSIGDVTGDGRPDIVYGVSTRLGVLVNTGAGLFTDTTVAVAYFQATAIGDLNGDGTNDIGARNGSGQEQYYLNTGPGAFVLGTQSNPVAGGYAQSSADLNGDGRTDIVVAGSGTPSVLLNLGNASAPSVTTNPTDQTVAAGSTATFTAAATGVPAPTVQWQVSTDGVTYNNIGGATSTSYSVSTAYADNGKRYRAVFSNNQGSATTSSAVLTVTPTAPAITQNPSDQNVGSGQTATFTAAASGDPAPTVQWQVSTDGTTFADISGATSTSYSFQPSYAASGNLYRAVFTNTVSSATTTAATLNVNAAAPVLTQNPTDQSVASGATASFTAAASGDPNPSVQWQRSTDGGANFTDVNDAGSTSTTYSVTPSYADNNNRYRAVFTNVGGTATTTAAILTVTALAPVVTTQPSDQVVGSGGTATFVAAASGDPSPTVQWQVSIAGGAFTDLAGATSPTLDVAAVFADTGNRYQAVFSNPGGSDTSNSALLTVNPIAPVVTSNPVDQTANPGDSVSFSAAASGDPSPTVQWQRATTASAGVFTDLPGETATTLTVTVGTADDQNSYRAVFTNLTGSTQTSAAVLSVSAIAPVVTTDPADQTVTAGDPVTFTAAASGDPSPTVQWQLSADNGSSYTDLTGETSTSLTFTATAGDHGNRYRAVFSNRGGTAASTGALLSVNTAPQLTSQPTDATVNAGDTATFSASADGRPTPSVQWQLSTDGGSTFADIAGATATSYTTPATVPADHGNLYQAVFTNSVASATSNAATLSVNLAPVVTTDPADATVNDGTTATFTAAASGRPAPSVQWQLSSDGGSSFTDLTGETSTTLTFTATAGDNANQYRAVFTNTAGTARSAAATLTVNTTPVITTQPADATVNEGSTATFSAAASGRPTPTVQWQLSTDGGSTFADIAGATAPDYTTAPTVAADQGNQYRAVFSNTVGATATNPATLSVNLAATVTTQPADATVNEGSTATFTATASGRPAPSVQWQLSTDGGGSYTDIAGATGTSYTTPATVAGDTGNQYRAIFTNTAGTDTTRWATLTVIATPGPVLTAPSAPLNVHATQTGPGQITVTWDTPADPGSTPITGYDAGYGNGSSGNGTTVPFTSHQAVFNGLSAGSYQASVAALNAAGSGPRVFITVTVTTATTPIPTTPTTPTTPVTPTVPTIPAGIDTLARTGSGSADPLALLLLSLGAGLGYLARRRRSNNNPA